MFKFPDPYLIVGTGRSGTSTVAKIFHTKLKVFMGYKFPKSDKTNPEGFWEDLDFYHLNRNFVGGKIPYQVWLREVWQVIMARRCMNIPWGFKESRMAHLLGNYLGFFDTPRVVRCCRKKELVVESLQRCYGYDEKTAFDFWRIREKTLDRILKYRKEILTINFDESILSDEEIINLVRGKWKDIGKH